MDKNEIYFNIDYVCFLHNLEGLLNDAGLVLFSIKKSNDIGADLFLVTIAFRRIISRIDCFQKEHNGQLSKDEKQLQFLSRLKRYIEYYYESISETDEDDYLYDIKYVIDSISTTCVTIKAVTKKMLNQLI